MRAPTFRTALVAAACAHVAMALALTRVHAPAAGVEPARDLTEALFNVSEEPIEPVAQVPAVSPIPEPEPGAAAQPRETSLRSPPASAPAVPGDGQPAPEPQALAPAPASSAEPWSMPATQPLALGIDGYWKSVALAARSAVPTASTPPDRAPSQPSLDRVLRGDLEARDRSLGLGSSGPLVSAAHEAAGPSIAPEVGTATLEIECDAGGKVVSARVVSSSAEPAKWNAVAREIMRLASTHPLRVPPGARGVRTRLRIVAERTLPSGTKLASTPGAVPDDVAGNGSGEKVCEGEGATRKCLKGMPAGATGSFGDLANIGAKLARLVHVAVVSEDTL